MLGFGAVHAARRTVWDDKALDRFLAAALKMVPGSTMTYDGMTDRRERADLIDYLKHAAKTAQFTKQR